MDLQQFARQEFRGLQRPALVNAARILDKSFNAGNMADENLRAKCVSMYEATYGPIQRSLKAVFKAPPTPEQGDYKVVHLRQPPPNGLQGVGKWMGRRRLVTLASTDKTRSQVIPFRWEETCEVLLKPNVKTSIPWPIYDILINQERILSPSMQYDPVQHRDVFTTVEFIEGQWPFTDHGDDPETANQPRSLAEFYRWQCLSNSYYRKLKRHEIEDRLAIMTDGMKNRAWCRDRTDPELREILLEHLGFRDVIDAELEAIGEAERAQELAEQQAYEDNANTLTKAAA